MEIAGGAAGPQLHGSVDFTKQVGQVAGFLADLLKNFQGEELARARMMGAFLSIRRRTAFGFRVNATFFGYT